MLWITNNYADPKLPRHVYTERKTAAEDLNLKKKKPHSNIWNVNDILDLDELKLSEATMRKKII